MTTPPATVPPAIDSPAIDSPVIDSPVVAPTSEAFRRAVDLRPVEAQVLDDAWLATTQHVPWPKAYGGDLVAQAAVAMMRSVDADRSLHSLHGYFMRPVPVGADVRYEVERLRDGRGYSTRSLRAFAGGKPVYAALGSFHVPEGGDGFQPQAPATVDPDSLRAAADVLDGVGGPAAEYWSRGRSFDMRHVPGPVYLSVDGGTDPHQCVWVRAFERLDDDADLHRAALAYVCDYTILEPLLRVGGLAWSDPGLVTASLDHSMWFHRDGRADDWVLYAQEAVSAQRNRGLAFGRFFDRSGRLLATVAQEGMIRPGPSTEPGA